MDFRDVVGAGRRFRGDCRDFVYETWQDLRVDSQDIWSGLVRYYRQNAWFQGFAQGLVILAIVAGFDRLLGHPVGARMAYLVPVFHATQRGGRVAGSLLVAASLMMITAANYNLAAEARATMRTELILSLVVLVLGMLLVDRTQRKLARIQHIASTDPLTGALNRLALATETELLLSAAVEDQSAVSVVLVDCDGFKQLNDTYGHRVGDQVLTTLVAFLQKAVGDSGSVGRTGGDEFVLVLPRRRRVTIDRVMEQVRERFESTCANLGHPASFSYGVSEYRLDGLSLPALLEAADRDMYRAKEERRQAQTETYAHAG